MDTLAQDLLHQIECPVCFEYMAPPITVCQNGHNICNPCKSNLDSCPMCRSNLSDVRSQTAETVSRTITHRCKYRELGCTGQVLVDFKEIHEESCKFRPMRCPFLMGSNCHWEGALKNVAEHIRLGHNAHSTLNVLESEQELTINNYKERTDGNTEYIGWVQAVFTLEEVFFVRVRLVNNALYITYLFVGVEEAAKKYKFKVTLKTADEDEYLSGSLVCTAAFKS